MRRRVINRLRGQAGFTLIEATIASAFVIVAMLVSFETLQSARKVSQTGQRETQAAALMQREIEAVKALPFSLVAMQTPLPVHAETGTYTADQNPRNPNYYVNPSGPSFRIMRSYANRNGGSPSDVADSGGYEPMVDGGSGGLVDPESDVHVGAVKFRVYRYVTYRQEAALLGLNTVDLGPLSVTISPPVKLCPPVDISKRVTIAVIPHSQRAGRSAGEREPQQAGTTRPLYTSTVLTKPASGPLVVDGPANCTQAP